MSKPAQILFFSRPHDMHLHAALGEYSRLLFPHVPVIYATFFRRTVDFLKTRGIEAVYLPTSIRNSASKKRDDCDMEEIEAEVMRGSGGATLGMMLQSERFLPAQREAAVEFMRCHVFALNDLIGPGTLSISSMFDHFVYWLAGSLANARNGWHFSFVSSAVPVGRTIALKTPWNTWAVPVGERECHRLLESSRMAQSRPAEERLWYMGKRPPRDRRPVSYHAKLAWEMWCDSANGSYFSPHWASPLSWAIRKFLPGPVGRAIYQYREPDYDINSDRDLPGLGHPAVYFPLHMEPEATVLLFSPWCRDQIEAARVVSQALPVNWRLLVKENPKMQGVRPREYYDRLSAIPNVLLVHPRVSSGELARQSRATISIAGNASLESVLLGRPGICLGKPPFRDLLTMADFSGGFKLSELNTVIRRGSPGQIEIPKESWQRWVAGTVDVPMSYVSFGKDHGFSATDREIRVLWEYICTAASFHCAVNQTGEARHLA